MYLTVGSKNGMMMCMCMMKLSEKCFVNGIA